MKDKEFLTYQEAADMIGKKVVTIKTWARKGLINRYAPTKTSVFVKKTELLRLLEGGKQ